MKQGWEIKKLGEVASYVNGYAFKPEHWGETGVPIIRIQNLNNLNADFNYCESDIPQKFVIEDGDILISWSAIIGVYEWNRGKAYLNQHIFKVVFDKINISKYFLKYAVSAKLNEMLKDAHGATMKHIVKSDFDNTTIPYPPLPEQEKIVAELDCLSGVIEKKKQQLKELDLLAQSIFYTMFGDPISNEKGWEVKKLGEVARVIGGYAFKSNLFTEDGIPVLRIGNINTGLLKTTSIVFYREDEALTKYLVYPQDLVMSLTGTAGKDDYGNVCVLDDTYPKYYLNQRNAKFVLSGNIQVDYLKHVLKDKQIKSKLTGVNRGIRQGNIANRDIEELLVQIPPLVLQQEYADKIEAIEKQKELIKQSITETEELFNSRMDYYFG